MSNVLKMLSRGGAAAAETDPNFKQTVLLLHGDGTNGAQNNTFLDSSSNNFTITRNPATGPNAPTQGTFSPFSAEPGKWSNFFDGNSDWLSVPANAAFDFGSGDFTVEAWVYLAGNSPLDGLSRRVANIFSVGSASSFNFNFLIFGDSTTTGTGLEIYNGTNIVNVAGTINQNTWNHIAVSKSGTSVYFWLNGSQFGATQTTSGNWGSSVNGAQVGRTLINNFTFDLNGYISNLRVVKGRAVYTSAFTPPTVPLGATSGGTNPPQGTETSLLTCQSNRFVDNGGLATKNTITRNGDVRVTPFSPFAPTAAYSAGTNGGSGYFDGTGDFLSSPNNSAIHVLGSDFCLEGWFYLETSQSNRGLYSTYANVSGNEFGYFLRLDTTIIRFYYGDGVGSGVAIDRTFTFTQGQWYHFAVTNSGGTGRIFVNGVQQGATFTFVSPSNSTTDLQIGQTHTVTNPFLGYLSSFRVVKGRAVYTSDFTPPTAPLGTTSGGTNPPQGSETSLLLNFTNAGILDQTGKNVLETVGNAQIDTAVKKYGTGSLEFDGNGDILVARNIELLDFPSGDFTVEFWYNTNTLTPTGGTTPGFAFIVGKTNWNGTSGAGWCIFQYNQEIRFFHPQSSSLLSINTGNVITSTGTWYHIAVVRSGTATNNTKIYINGVQQAQGTPTITTSTQSLLVGGTNTTYGWDSTYWTNGFIDDLRITKGVARYPTEPFPTASFPDL